MRVFAHTKESHLEIVGKRGQWRFNLPDGTYLIAFAHDDHVLCRHELERHPAVLHVLPRRSEGAPISGDALAAINRLLSEHLQTKPLTSGAPTHEVLDAIYRASGDPMFHPDSSM